MTKDEKKACKLAKKLVEVLVDFEDSIFDPAVFYNELKLAVRDKSGGVRGCVLAILEHYKA